MAVRHWGTNTTLFSVTSIIIDIWDGNDTLNGLARIMTALCILSFGLNKSAKYSSVFQYNFHQA